MGVVRQQGSREGVEAWERLWRGGAFGNSGDLTASLGQRMPQTLGGKTPESEV